MKKKYLNIILWVVTIIAIVVAILAVYRTTQKEDELRSLKDVIKTVVQKEVASIGLRLPEPKDGYTPRKNIDYFDGKPGENGRDGKDGQNVTDAQVDKAVKKYFKENPIVVKDGVDGKDGSDGITPEIRCNAVRNRWEIRYGIEEAWQVLNGEKVKCTTGENE